MNAKKELLDHIEDRGVKYARVIRVSVIREHSYDNKETIDGTLDEVLPMLDFEYDNGYGRQELYGTIWYSDGTWSDRQECDGAEWWEHGPSAESVLSCDMNLKPKVTKNILCNNHGYLTQAAWCDCGESHHYVRYSITGTSYGFLHNSSGGMRLWKSYSGAAKWLRKNREIYWA